MKILFFAKAREAAGCENYQLDVDQTLSMTELWERLIADFPGLAPLQKTSRLARGGAYLQEGGRLKPDDEVAIIPPVSGG